LILVYGYTYMAIQFPAGSRNMQRGPGALAAYDLALYLTVMLLYQLR